MDFIYEAHTGVGTEAPWNTMPAFYTAVAQGYKMIELDLGVTKDKKLVVLHDETINKTARKSDGSRLSEDVYINSITYKEALEYDFGIEHSLKFKGTRIPLFDEVVELAKKNDVKLKIDNKYERFSEDEVDLLFEAVKNSAGTAQLTCKYIEQAKMAKDRLGDCEIHYDGEVDEGILEELSALYPKDKMTVWVALPGPATWWAERKMPIEELCGMVKKYAKLGIWILSDEGQTERAKELGADVIETNGVVKPRINMRMKPDMHTHSDNSHDSRCPVAEMAKYKADCGINVMAVTDHVDMQFWDNQDIPSIVRSSHADAKHADGKNGIRVMTGLEMGEAIWNPHNAEMLVKNNPCDVVIGSVHAVRYKELTMPYAQIDFSALGETVIYEFLAQYFDDYECMVRTTNCDVAAHITCPMRYINGKYNCGIDLGRFDEKVAEILYFVIKRKLALEINLSCLASDTDFAYYKKLLKTYKNLGGYLVTIGSDNHEASGDMNRYDAACSMLKEAGFQNVYYYANRTAIQCGLE